MTRPPVLPDTLRAAMSATAEFPEDPATAMWGPVPASEPKGAMPVNDFSNQGILSRNDKRTSDTHAEFKGDADLTCPHCGKGWKSWLDAWVRERKDGTGKFFSLKFKPKDAAPAARKPAPAGAEIDSIPF
jgi:hypothetical protein